MIGFFIALLSGALMSVQGVFNTQVTKATSLWVCTGWVQLTAFLVCIVAWYVTGKESVGALLQVQPRYMLIGGLLGAGITVTVIKSMATLGPAKSTMLIVITQIAVSYLIEVFGMFGVDTQEFSWRKLIGIVLAVFGIIIFK